MHTVITGCSSNFQTWEISLLFDWRQLQDLCWIPYFIRWRHFFGLYTPGIDTVISGVAWTDDKIYISLSEGNRLACIMIIDDIHDFEIPKDCCKPRFSSDSTILNAPNIIKRHTIRQNGVGWFGRFTTY